MSEPRWETKYKKLLGKEPVDKRITELSRRIQSLKDWKNIGEFKTKEEYEAAKSKKDNAIAEFEKELEDYKNYEKNKDKIANILEYRNKLQEKLEKLSAETKGKLEGKKTELENKKKEVADKKKELEGKKKEIADKKKELESKKNSIEELRKQCDEYQAKVEGLQKKIKAAKSADEKTNLEQELNEARKTFGEVQDKQIDTFKEVQEAEKQIPELEKQVPELEKQIPELEKQVPELENTIKEIENPENKVSTKKAEYERKIAKCNIIAANLLKGKELGEFDLKVEEGRFTSKAGRVSEKGDTGRSESSTTPPKREPKTEGAELSEEETEASNGELSMTETSDFAKKFPVFARIGNWFKNIKNRFMSFVNKNKEEREEVPEEVVAEVPETVAEVTDNERNAANILDLFEKIENDEKSEDEMLAEIAKNGHKKYIENLRVETKMKAVNKLAKKYGGAYEKQDGATAKKKDDGEVR